MDFSSETRLFLDHLGREVAIPLMPKRIVSLCPSQTETLFDLGLGDRVVGRTHFCIHPADGVEAVTAVGGTKKISFERLEALNPDLIIGEKEENTPEMVAEMEKRWPVYITDVTGVDSALKMMGDLGQITGTAALANDFVARIQAGFEELPKLTKSPRGLYFIWRKPWMVAAQPTYIGDLLQKIGIENMALRLYGRYPEISEAEIRDFDPEIIWLSSEPYPFKQEHEKIIQTILPKAKIQLVDGEMFSWYGTRMLQAPTYLRTLINSIPLA